VFVVKKMSSKASVITVGSTAPLNPAAGVFPTAVNGNSGNKNYSLCMLKCVIRRITG